MDKDALGIGQGASSTARLDVRRATALGDYEAAFRCVCHKYCQRGLSVARPGQIRLIRHHLLASTRVFVARQMGKLVGTLSLVEDQPLGIPMRAVFDRAISGSFPQDCRVAEASCLAVAGAGRSGLNVVHHLIGVAAQAAQIRGIGRVLIAVHPRHASFYSRLVGFRPFATAQPYPSVGGLPAVAMELDLTQARVNCREAYRRYFGMKFSEAALDPTPAPADFLHHLAKLWIASYQEDLETAEDRLFDDDRQSLRSELAEPRESDRRYVA